MGDFLECLDSLDYLECPESLDILDYLGCQGEAIVKWRLVRKGFWNVEKIIFEECGKVFQNKCVSL